jgi:hypothetical protein
MDVIHFTRGADPPIDKGADTQSIAVEKVFTSKHCLSSM